jgi:hypothetical protein
VQNALMDLHGAFMDSGTPKDQRPGVLFEAALFRIDLSRRAAEVIRAMHGLVDGYKRRTDVEGGVEETMWDRGARSSHTRGGAGSDDGGHSGGHCGVRPGAHHQPLRERGGDRAAALHAAARARTQHMGPVRAGKQVRSRSPRRVPRRSRNAARWGVCRNYREDRWKHGGHYHHQNRT